MSKTNMHRMRGRGRALAVALLSGIAGIWSAVPAQAQEEPMDRDDREFAQRIEREVVALPPEGALVAAPPAVPLIANEYAVKFVCGRMGGGGSLNPVINGFYATAVNIHNPAPVATLFWRKVAIAPPGVPGRITGFRPINLLRDQAVEIDCRQIFLQVKQAGIPIGAFLKGFLVIRSPRQLDVVAVYTAGPQNGQGVSSIHTERVPPRRVP
jgi:hypothetical protein